MFSCVKSLRKQLAKMTKKAVLCIQDVDVGTIFQNYQLQVLKDIHSKSLYLGSNTLEIMTLSLTWFIKIKNTVVTSSVSDQKCIYYPLQWILPEICVFVFKDVIAALFRQVQFCFRRQFNFLVNTCIRASLYILSKECIVLNDLITLNISAEINTSDHTSFAAKFIQSAHPLCRLWLCYVKNSRISCTCNS